MWSCFEDLHILKESGILPSITYIGGEKLWENLEVLMEFLPDLRKSFPTKEGNSLRKLVGLPDKEGKTRVIAILDYFSQTCLKPVHDELFSFLRKIHQDVTFNQGSYQDKVRS